MTTKKTHDKKRREATEFHLSELVLLTNRFKKSNGPLKLDTRYIGHTRYIKYATTP
jgi:hypothetical protein